MFNLKFLLMRYLLQSTSDKGHAMPSTYNKEGSI